jgi:cytoskeletal protein CcmA (bactofilin family)
MFGKPSILISHARGLARPDPVGVSGRRSDLIASLLVALLLASQATLFTPRTAQAAEIRHGDSVVVAPGETIDDDLYAFGQTVSIQGTVNGDVITAGQSISVAGHVNGDLMAAGSTIVVNGPVTGAARLAGQSIEIGAPIGNDLLAGAATLNSGPQASIGRDILVGGQTVNLGGPVGRSVRAGAETLTIGGPVGSDILAQVGTLHLASGARIQGSLTYTSNNEAVLDPGAAVNGPTTRFEASDSRPEPSPASRFGTGAVAWLQTLVGMSLFGLLLVLVFPGIATRSTQILAENPWASLGIGFAVLLGVPIAALLLFGVGLAIGGWWIGPLLLALYLGALPVGYTMAGLLVGHAVMQKAGRSQSAIGWHLLAGLVLFGLVGLVPILGGLVLFAALLFGLGASVLAVLAMYRGRSSREVAPPSNGVHVEQAGEPIAAR